MLSRNILRQTASLRTFSTSAQRQFTPFDWQDPLRVESTLLTEEEYEIMQSARAYSQAKLAPRLVEQARTEEYDPNIMLEFGELGLLGPTVEGYGCAGTTNVAYGLIAREVERVDSGYRSMMSVQSSLVMHPISTFGSDALKEKYLPKLATAETIGCFGLTEPDFGSDPSSMATVAKKVDGGFVLNGSKTWITNSPIADILLVWARSEWDQKIRGFIIDREGATGLSTPKISNKTALRASITGSIFMDEVFVPAENVLDVTGLKGPFDCLNSARLGIAFGTIGALEAGISFARDYALQRHQFKKPLAAFQLVQKKLADAEVEAAIGLTAAVQVAKCKDSGEYSPEMISIVKRNNCFKAVTHTRTLMEIFGGNACAEEYPLMRISGNMHIASTYEGTYDVHGLIIGKAITGINAFA